VPEENAVNDLFKRQMILDEEIFFQIGHRHCSENVSGKAVSPMVLTLDPNVKN